MSGKKAKLSPEAQKACAEATTKIQELETEIRKHNLRVQDLTIRVRAKDHEFCAGLGSFSNLSSQLIKVDGDFDEWTILHEELMEESTQRWKKLIELRQLYSNTLSTIGSEQKSELRKVLMASPLIAGLPRDPLEKSGQAPEAYEGRELSFDDIEYSKNIVCAQDPYFTIFPGVCRNVEVFVMAPKEGIAGQHFLTMSKTLKKVGGGFSSGLMFLGSCSDPELLVFESCPFTLHTVFKQRGVSFWKKLNWIQSLVSAMVWFHALPDSPCHLNLNPQSVYVTSNFAIKLGHWERAGVPITASLKYIPSVYSPLAYQSPDHTLTQKSDVFSFGMLVYYILAEKHPFPGSLEGAPAIDWQKVAQDFRAGKRPSLAGFSTAVQEFLQRCWQPNPNDRPTFAELSKTDYHKLSLSSVKEGNEAALAIWKDFSVGGQQLAFVPWECFVQRFVEFIGPLKEAEKEKLRKKAQAKDKKKAEKKKRQELSPSQRQTEAIVQKHDVPERFRSKPPTATTLRSLISAVNYLQNPTFDSELDAALHQLIREDPDVEPYGNQIKDYWKTRISEYRTKAVEATVADRGTISNNCLRATLATIPTVSEASAQQAHKGYSQEVVTLGNYQKFCELFGPIQGGEKWLEGFVATCRQPWFYGCISSDYSQRVLQKSAEAKIKMPYLVRISANSNGFTLDVYGSKVNSYRLTDVPKLGLVAGVEATLVKILKKKGHPCAFGRRYDAYFSGGGGRYEPMRDDEAERKTDQKPGTVVLYPRGTSLTFIT